MMTTSFKRNVCRGVTLGSGVATLLISNQPQLIDGQPVGLIAALVSAIFTTQWVHYQKQLDHAMAQPQWPAWLRRMLY